MVLWYYEDNGSAPSLVVWDTDYWRTDKAIGSGADFSIHENCVLFDFYCDIYVGF